ncbi:general transcription factor II-I repeat domain-containing protein 2A-like [Centruroides vittatus]|uniref:general transcription factor II-I repeat domain-containing protein 2A-like n=1 Tax=Centruroides vittatus TaxID=120091 RepID=UPI003510BC42
MVFNDFSVKEELLKLLSMQEQTRGEDIYNNFKNYLTEINMPSHKLSAIITDGVPAMVGCNNGFTSHCQKDESFLNFIYYHCIIHQESLCAKILSFEHVINVVVKITNKIQANPLSHRLFNALVEKDKSFQADLILHTDIRWLNKSKTLGQFFDLLEEIKNSLFQKMKRLNWFTE